MRKTSLLTRGFVAQGSALLILALASAIGFAAETPSSEWARPGAGGKLTYKPTPAGDRILDFSHAGYRGGGVALPNVPVKRTVSPSGGEDDTAAIQAAIDEVSKLPLQDGFRGAVLLAPGTFTCARPISLRASGVVLRGSGSSNGTTLRMAGDRHTAITMGSARGRGGRGAAGDDDADPEEAPEPARAFTAASTSIADAYVPSGAYRFTVADAKGFAVGDRIVIRRPTTAAWVKFMEMNTLTRNGRPQTWIGVGRDGFVERRITAISGGTITVDVPLADSYDAKHLSPPGTIVSKVRESSAPRNIGVEQIHIQCPAREMAYGQHPYSAIHIDAEDSWVRDVFCEETMNATVIRGQRITMQQVRVKHTYPNLGASKPTDFSIEGGQILLDRCRISGDNMYYVWTTSLNQGPNVLLNCVFTGHGSRVQPHMRWSTGLLVDNCKVPDGGIDFMNRGVMGSGHGWTMGWAVAWNCIAKTYVIQKPPGVFNWAIGCIGERVKTARPFDAEVILPEGEFDSHGTPVAPQSLYLAQLAERLGPEALKNIGYPANTAEAFADASAQGPVKLPRDEGLGEDLAFRRPINAGNVRARDRQFGGENAVDNDPKTFWATDDNPRRATLIVDMEGPVDVNAVTIEEAVGSGRVLEYRVEGQIDSTWKVLAQGTTIGERQVHRFPAATVWKVQLTIVKSEPYAAIRKFGLYHENRPEGVRSEAR